MSSAVADVRGAIGHEVRVGLFSAASCGSIDIGPPLGGAGRHSDGEDGATEGSVLEYGTADVFMAAALALDLLHASSPAA